MKFGKKTPSRKTLCVENLHVILLTARNTRPNSDVQKHTDTVNTKAKRWLNILRAFTHTNYRRSLEHITTVYKRFIRPVVTYAHTAWQTLLKNTLQQTTNYAKCGSMYVYRLHLNNTNRPCPLRNKSPQNTGPYGHERHTLAHFLHRTTTPTTLSHPRPPAKQEQMETPSLLLLQTLQHFSPAPRKTSLWPHIHTHFAHRSMYSMQSNTILNSCTLSISEEEKTLSRE